MMFAAAAIPLFAAAVPRLQMRAEIVADGELKAKVLENARGIPAPTLQMRQYTVTSNGESKDVKWYLPRDVWRQRAFVGEWKDASGNVMRLARVLSLVPTFEREDWYKDEIEKRLDGLEKVFRGTDAELEAWKTLWGSGDNGVGMFFEVKGGRKYYVEFEFAEEVTEKEAEKLLAAFGKSVSSSTRGTSPNRSSMKWWEEKNDRYRFLTDLDRAKGMKFVKDAMRLVDAMRRSYEFYVPPAGKVGMCTVRVFKTIGEYREYRLATGDADDKSCGLWDPSREELLVAAENHAEAQATMRHEAFHQYLHYATGRGDHAMWFNEGHACFFESVCYNPAKKSVSVILKGNRSSWVAKNPALYANSIMDVVRMDRDRFYSGDINRNYCTAWAICYFLEKGAYTSDCFAPYRRICPKYLELMASGASAEDATASAWAIVADRNVAADFMRFWKEKLKAAEKAR